MKFSLEAFLILFLSEKENSYSCFRKTKQKTDRLWCVAGILRQAARQSSSFFFVFSRSSPRIPFHCRSDLGNRDTFHSSLHCHRSRTIPTTIAPGISSVYTADRQSEICNFLTVYKSGTPWSPVIDSTLEQLDFSFSPLQSSRVVSRTSVHTEPYSGDSSHNSANIWEGSHKAAEKPERDAK